MTVRMRNRMLIAAVGMALAAGGCNRGLPPANQANATAPAPTAPAPTAPAAKPVSGVGDAAAGSAEQVEVAAAAEAPHEDRSGPTRDARCEIDGGGPVACRFTPVLGDGSFDIDTPNHNLRLLVDGGEAALFDRVGARRIPLPGLLRRDAADPACWVTDDPDATIGRVCAR